MRTRAAFWLSSGSFRRCWPCRFRINTRRNQLPTRPLRRATELVAVGGLCAEVFVEENAAAAISVVRASCKEKFNMPEAEVDAMLAEIGKRTKEMASLFEINIGSGQSFEDVLKKANETLVEMTLQSQIHATSLQEQNVQLKKQATTEGAHWARHIAPRLTSLPRAHSSRR